MTDEKKDSSDIYQISESATLPETVITPSDSSDIFAIKNENVSQLGSLIGMALSEGVFLCQAYRLDKHLSRDEMGETWKASDLRASRNVIIYLPPQEIRKDEPAIEPIRQNAKHVEALDHLRIVPLWGNFTDLEHGFFTVRKFVNGKTLDVYRTDYVRRHKKLIPSKVVKMLSDIAHALDYAHSVDIVHGDLCLKNIIVGLDDEVYVDNFALQPAQTATASAERKPYHSPEVIEGHATTARSDIYALAVIAYNLLSGRLPFLPETMDGTPLPIPGVPSTVDAVIRKAMAKEPDDRYNSCGAFVRALEAGFLESKKIKSLTVTPSLKPSRNNRAAPRVKFWMTLVGLLSIVGGAVAMLYMPSSTMEPLPGGIEIAEQLVVNPVPEQRQEARLPREPIPAVQPRANPPVNPEKPDNAMEETTEAEDVPVTPQNGALPSTTTTTIATEQQERLPHDPVKNTNNLERNDNLGQSDVPQQDNTVSLFEAEPKLRISPADVMRDEGETTEITIGGIPYRFHWCKPFPMGIDGFWIQEIPVAHETWSAVMGNRRLREQPAYGGRLPVVMVSWNDCDEFVKRLNGNPGILASAEFDKEYERRFSLPTEAQWEYAYHLEVLDVREEEWCGDWYDEAKNDRVVRGDSGYRKGRYPGGQGFRNVGFRLVIVP